jgi:hypothetical protein
MVMDSHGWPWMAMDGYGWLWIVMDGHLAWMTIENTRKMLKSLACFQMSVEFYHSIKHGLAFFIC